MVGIFNRLIAPYARRIRLTVSRGIVRLVSDALPLQEVQIALLADETRGQVERLQNYGFTSVPHPGAEGAFLSVGGSRDHGIVIAVDDRRYRLKGLKQGEVALYDDKGQQIILGRDGIVVNAPLGIHINGQLTVAGNIIAAGEISDRVRSMSADRLIYNGHRHGTSPQTTEQM